jgi:hypothetical protein
LKTIFNHEDGVNRFIRAERPADQSQIEAVVPIRLAAEALDEEIEQSL